MQFQNFSGCIDWKCIFSGCTNCRYKCNFETSKLKLSDLMMHLLMYIRLSWFYEGRVKIWYSKRWTVLIIEIESGTWLVINKSRIQKFNLRGALTHYNFDFSTLKHNIPIIFVRNTYSSIFTFHCIFFSWGRWPWIVI